MSDLLTPPSRILVVDDSVDSAETFAILLRLWGHDVQTAHGGEEAVASARTYRPDVVLLDIGLPDIDGYAVAMRLREEGLPGRLLVALTGYDQADEAERSRKAGFHHHLTKPVDPDALLRVVGRALPKN